MLTPSGLLTNSQRQVRSSAAMVTFLTLDCQELVGHSVGRRSYKTLVVVFLSKLR